MRKALLILLTETTLAFVSAFAQDPGLPDSLIVGNLDRSLIQVRLGDQIEVPVWL